MKGENLLYNNVVPNALAENQNGVQSQRNTYLEERSNAMACRFYYHATLCRRRYDDCLLHLTREFFLESDTIISYLKSKTGLINSLNSKQVTHAKLRKNYPWLDWTVKETILQSKIVIKTTPAGSYSLF